jgi:response regulator RpfG family c-di-GMP phosphodiesterase
MITIEQTAPFKPAPAEELAAGPAVADSKEPASPVEQIRGVVLLVESDDEICRLIARLLHCEGYMVLKTSTLAEARLLLCETHADLLLARRASVPQDLDNELLLHEIAAKTATRIVDNYSELMLGQVVDYESMSQSQVATLDLLMSLLEVATCGQRGHAHNVAKYCRLIGQRMGISRRDLDALVMAAYLHDLGNLVITHKIGSVLDSDGTPVAPSYQKTAEMLSSIPFAHAVCKLLMSDLDPAPAPQTDKRAEPNKVPLSMRILRVADCYDSLRRQAPEVPNEELYFDWMRSQSPQLVDPEVVQEFINIRKKEQAISAMNLFAATVLLVNSHPDELQPLQLRLENEDYRVLVAKSPAEALQLLRQQTVTLVLSDFQFENEQTGLTLLASMKRDPALRMIPLVFLAAADIDRVKQALEYGAEDWLAKPHNVEILAMKLNRIIRRTNAAPKGLPDGVQGNVRDMGVIELVQILSAANRSVQILFEHGTLKGELVMQTGKIIHATCCEMTGDPAAIELLLLVDGRFRMAPLHSVPPTTVTMSTDSLIMESCLQKDLRAQAAPPAS